jgi:hypothetical protein
MRKDYVFQNYWWMAAVVAAIAIVVIVLSKAPERGGLIGTTIGTALAFCYFAQKQKLDELTLFKTLFTEFNHRYDEMNDKLEDIRAGNQVDNSDLRKILVGYFNLCAEEYLFYREGFIHQAAWRSWCLGIKYYLEDERIRRIWDDEVSKDSYYGLTLEIVQAGASLLSNSAQGQKLARIREKGVPA